MASTSSSATPPAQVSDASAVMFSQMAQAAAMAQQKDTSTWVSIYPCYLNAEFSTSRGRKIPLSLAHKNPFAPHIYETVLRHLSLPCVLERKRHPKDWKYLGRIKVCIKDPDTGSYLREDIKSRQQLYKKVAEMMPRQAAPEASKKQGGVGGLPSRKKK